MNGIIPAAGKGVRFKELGKNYPKCILPVDGKPIIYWNIKDMFDAGCDQVFIVVRDKEQEEKIGTVLNYFFPHQFSSHKILFVHQMDELGVGLSVAIQSALLDPKLNIEEPTFIMLSDLRVEDKNWSATSFRDDFSWISIQKVDSYERWCMVERSHNLSLSSPIPSVRRFYDKPKEDPKVREAVSGVYYFRDSELLFEGLQQQLEKYTSGEYQLSDAMNYYKEYEDIRVLSYDITDYGTLEEYLENKDLKLGRSFNDIEMGHVVKKSSHQLEKIVSEINWFRTMPEDLQPNLPRIYSFDLGTNNYKAYYKMERLTGTSLRDILLFLDSTPETWTKILDQITELHKTFCSHRTKTTVSSYNDFILSKTLIRMRSAPEFFAQEQVEDYISWLEGIIQKRQDIEMSLIHGDLCFSNIFWNFQTEQIKLIDPRGDIFGNPLYDIAKLTHSILFNYDFIDEELYIESDDIILIMGEGKEKIKDLWIDTLFRTYGEKSVRVILALTSSLFYSMIPLHSNEINKWLFAQTGRRIVSFLQGNKLTRESLKLEVHNEFETFTTVPKILSN